MSSLRELQYRDADGARFEHRVVGLNVAMLVCLALSAGGLFPPWSLVVIVPVLFVRWLAALHELAHIRSDAAIGFLARLAPILVTPLSVGYRELRREHLLHHKYALGPLDPTLYLVRGSRVRALAMAFTAPERIFFRTVRARSFDRRLLLEGAIRLGLFVALAWAARGTFLWFFAAIRIGYTLSFFAFFHALHRRGDRMGIFETVLPSAVAFLTRLVFGDEVYFAICHHDIHHAHARVAARALPEVARRARGGVDAAAASTPP